MSKKTNVVQIEGAEIATEILAKAIIDISEGIKKLRSGPLTDKALLILIQHSACTKDISGGRYSLREISDILNGLEDLSSKFLKKSKK